MADKQVSMVVKIEYEIEDNRDKVWTAYIMAYSQDEAVKYLAKFLRKTIKISSIGVEARRVDAISDQVREGITGKTLKKSKEEKKAEKKIEKEKKADVEPSKEELEKLAKAREKALEDLEKQGVEIYKAEKEKEKEEEEKPTIKPKTTRPKSIGIKTKK